MGCGRETDHERGSKDGDTVDGPGVLSLQVCWYGDISPLSTQVLRQLYLASVS